MSDLVHNLICRIEDEMKLFYPLSLGLRASEHLVSYEQAVEVKQDLHLHSNAVLVQESVDDNELFIGLYLQDKILNLLVEDCPFSKLSNENLHAYTVLVEELSHFHLIVHRSFNKSPISQLELEWQGEVDKLLFSAIRLRQQSGEAHYLHLARKLYDEAKIVSCNTERYWEATRYAAKLWYDLITYHDGIDDPSNSENLKLILRDLYHMPWQQKIYKIAQTRQVA